MPSVSPDRLREAMRRRGLDLHQLARSCDVPPRCVRRALEGDFEVTTYLLGAMAETLVVPPAQLTGELPPPDAAPALGEVVLDRAKVCELMRDRSYEEIRSASRNRITVGAIHRVRDGLPIRHSIALHFSRVLGVPLDDLLKKESTT